MHFFFFFNKAAIATLGAKWPSFNRQGKPASERWFCQGCRPSQRQGTHLFQNPKSVTIPKLSAYPSSCGIWSLCPLLRASLTGPYLRHTKSMEGFLLPCQPEPNSPVFWGWKKGSDWQGCRRLWTNWSTLNIRELTFVQGASHVSWLLEKSWVGKGSVWRRHWSANRT